MRLSFSDLWANLWLRFENENGIFWELVVRAKRGIRRKDLPGLSANFFALAAAAESAFGQGRDLFQRLDKHED